MLKLFIFYKIIFVVCCSVKFYIKRKFCMKKIFDFIIEKFRLIFCIFVGIFALNTIFYLIAYRNTSALYLVSYFFENLLLIGLLALALYGIFTGKSKLAKVSLAFFIIGCLFNYIQNSFNYLDSFYNGQYAIFVLENIVNLVITLNLAAVAVLLFLNIFINRQKIIEVVKKILLVSFCQYLVLLVLYLVGAIIYGSWFNIFICIQDALFVLVLIYACRYDVHGKVAGSEESSEIAQN